MMALVPMRMLTLTVTSTSWFITRVRVPLIGGKKKRFFNYIFLNLFKYFKKNMSH